MEASIHDDPIEILLVGREKRFHDLLRIVVGKTEATTRGRRERLRHGPGLERSTADLVAVEVHPWFQPAFVRAGWQIVPESIRWRIRLREFPPTDARESLRSDLRKVVSRGYRLEIASYRDHWRTFRDDMLAPLVHRRYGESAWHPSDRMLHELGRAAHLLYVCRDEQRLGGVVAVTRGKEVWIPFLGVRDGSEALVKSGVTAALYKLTLEWARDSGFEELDFGRTCPFSGDGLARFKRKWGLRPVTDALSPRYAMRVGTRSPRLAEAFARQPVYVLDPTGVGRSRVPGGERLATFRGMDGGAPAPLV